MVSHLAAVFAESPVLQALWGLLVVNGVKGCVLFGLAWTVLKLCRGLSSELKHVVWLLVIVSSLAFPLAWLLSPGIRLSVPVAIGRSTTPLFAAMPFTARSQFLQIMTVPGVDSFVTDYWTTLLRRHLPAAAGALWAAGALFFLQRLVVGRLVAGRLARRARPAPIEPKLLRELSGNLGVKGTLAVKLCRDCGIPFTFGSLRPVVLLPEAAAAWPRQRLRSVLLHELSHIRRRESLLNFTAGAICALLWFLPVLWLAYSFMQQEGEKSSDRAVLRYGIRRTDYATDLVELVHSAQGLILTAGAVVPLGRKRLVKERVRTVLAFRRGSLSRPFRTAGVALTILFCCLLPLLAVAGASVPGDRTLAGSWSDPQFPDSFYRYTWTADGRLFMDTRQDSAAPSYVGRYTIEEKRTDEEGNTWYHVMTQLSPAPYREALGCPMYWVIKIDPEGRKLECSQWPYGYPEELTFRCYQVFHRETQGKR
jgi:beta-lactamase regulating signal transducer with metallopeptidase domain